MIVVNALITDAFRKCSLTMDGDVPTGDQAMAGLKDLQSVLSELWNLSVHQQMNG